MGFLDGKVAVITGAGSGMGKASVELFAAEGASVVALDVSGAEKETAANAGGDVIAAHCDVSKESDVVDAFALHVAAEQALRGRSRVLDAAVAADQDHVCAGQNQGTEMAVAFRGPGRLGESFVASMRRSFWHAALIASCLAAEATVIVLAAAGVERLQAEQHFRSALVGLTVLRLDPKRFVPAPAQGALAIQCRSDDARVLTVLNSIDDAPSRAAVTAERDALARAEGGCDVAFGAHCAAVGGKHELVAMLERGGTVHTAHVQGANSGALGAAAWMKLDAAVRR